MNTNPLFAGRFDTPMGLMAGAVGSGDALAHLYFERETGGPLARLPVIWDNKALAAVSGQIVEFMEGRRQRFTLPLNPTGSAFQLAVWAELVRIPFGQTASYSELALRIGRPQACRAVGRANATNPIAIVVPCHRVIGTNGTLTGYAGGLTLKEALLALEALHYGGARTVYQTRLAY